MVSSAWAIILGVVSGVITSALVAGGVTLFRKVALPWYRAKIYDGVDVSGTWEFESDALMQKGQIELTQEASRLRGSLALIAPPDVIGRYEELRTFNVQGHITDRFIELSYRHTDRTRIGAGVFFLELVGDGRIMEGVQSMYDIGQSEVASANIIAVRPGAHKINQQQIELLTAANPQRRKAKKKKKEQSPTTDSEKQNAPTPVENEDASTTPPPSLP